MFELFYEIRAGKDTMLNSPVRDALQAMCVKSPRQRCCSAKRVNRRVVQVKQGRPGYNISAMLLQGTLCL